jgi:hypothetical protein
MHLNVVLYGFSTFGLKLCTNKVIVPTFIVENGDDFWILKQKLQKCYVTILLSFHEKHGISNVCDYRVIYSFIEVDSFCGGESHSSTKKNGCFICSRVM